MHDTSPSSFKREGLSLQILVVVSFSGSVSDIVIGWWSERNMGSIMAWVSKGRSAGIKKSSQSLSTFDGEQKNKYSPSHWDEVCARNRVAKAPVVLI